MEDLRQGRGARTVRITGNEGVERLRGGEALAVSLGEDLLQLAGGEAWGEVEDRAGGVGHWDAVALGDLVRQKL
jgi:hypothetical protein